MSAPIDAVGEDASTASASVVCSSKSGAAEADAVPEATPRAFSVEGERLSRGAGSDPLDDQQDNEVQTAPYIPLCFAPEDVAGGFEGS